MKPSESKFMKIGGGLKCDKEGCDYINPDINSDDYKNHINAPCPKCGSSLLTQKDFDTIQRALKLEFFTLKILKFLGINTGNKVFNDKGSIALSLNGTGKIFIKKI